VLNPRQISMYLYLTMLCDERGECSPTVDQIREDLGLYSTSMVFEALAALDDLGFITRTTQLVSASVMREHAVSPARARSHRRSLALDESDPRSSVGRIARAH
jgi:SOS-response transcriptional repressor LexA